MKYKCYFCGGTIEADEQVDIDYYNECKYPTCNDCYIKITDVIMDGQFDELIRRKKVREVGFQVNPTQFNVKARKKILDGRGIND